MKSFLSTSIHHRSQDNSLSLRFQNGFKRQLRLGTAYLGSFIWVQNWQLQRYDAEKEGFEEILRGTSTVFQVPDHKLQRLTLGTNIP